MKGSLNAWVRGIGSNLVGDLRKEIDIFLLTMKHKNSHRHQQSVNGEGDDTRSPANTRRKCGHRHESIFTAIEKDSQVPGENNAEKWNHSNENPEHSRLKRGTGGDTFVQGVSGHVAHLRRSEVCLYWDVGREILGWN